MKNWKKFLVMSLTGAALLGGSATTHGAYQLNEEVANPPAALQMATQIGMLEYENPTLRYAADKDAIVVLSFGTTYRDTRAKTIDATVGQIQNAHRGVKVVTAFTSHIVIKHIIENEGSCPYATPEETLEQLRREGYTRIALVPLAVVPGMEYKYDVALFHQYKSEFKKMTLATPLMYWQGQENQPDDVLEAMAALDLPKYRKGTAVLLMAHGTPDPSNAYYSVMQAKLNALGRNDVHIYTVEGWPNLETCITALKADGVENVTLMPLMLVAGDHANNDMAGDEDDSHKVILQNEGFNVSVRMKPLGENKKIRQLFVNHADEAWDALTK